VVLSILLSRLTLFCGCCICTCRVLTCTYISANRQDMTSVPYFCCAGRALATLAALGDAVARDDGTDKLNFRACLHGFPFRACLKRCHGFPPFELCACDCPCDELDVPDFSGCEYDRLILLWLLLSVYSQHFYWLFSIVHKNDISSLRSKASFSFFCCNLFLGKAVNCMNVIYPCWESTTVLLFGVSNFRKSRYLHERDLSMSERKPC
jgi:hypothetical protein